MATKKNPFLYHVTLASRLRQIAGEETWGGGSAMKLKGGLRADAKRSIGGSSYDAHSKGRIFLTSEAGLSFWFHRAVDHAQDQFDDPAKSGHVPVVLRMRRAGLKGVRTDKVGTEDAKAPAYFLSGSIEPTALEVWGGAGWAPIASFAGVDPALGADAEGGLLHPDESRLYPVDRPGVIGTIVQRIFG